MSFTFLDTNNIIDVLICFSLQLAQKIVPVLASYGLLSRVFGYVMDGGGNMNTMSNFLEDGVPLENIEGVKCQPLGGRKPYRQRCIPHRINGCCNKSVLDAKAYPNMDIKGTLKKLQSCITYIKKSSKGWGLWRMACVYVGIFFATFWTPVKTRFTSVSN